MVERLVLLEEHSDRPLVAITGVFEDVALVCEPVDLVVQPFHQVSGVICESLLSAFGGILPVVAVRNSDSELVCREKALVSKPGQFLVKLWECVREERLSDMSVWLFEGGVTDTFGLPTVNVTEHGWVFAARTAQTNLVVVEGDHEDWIDPSTSTVGVRFLEVLFRGSLAVIDDYDLKRAGAISLIEFEVIPVTVVAPRATVS
jgi:hypothetical protein